MSVIEHFDGLSLGGEERAFSAGWFELDGGVAGFAHGDEGVVLVAGEGVFVIGEVVDAGCWFGADAAFVEVAAEDSGADSEPEGGAKVIGVGGEVEGEEHVVADLVWRALGVA